MKNSYLNKRKFVKAFNYFWKIFFSPKVFVFIITGTGFMFLTFLTHNNALELGISGVASIFIGIGVNNYTTIETTLKDEQQLRKQLQFTIHMLHHIKGKIGKIQSKAISNEVTIELNEMNDYIELCIKNLE